MEGRNDFVRLACDLIISSKKLPSRKIPRCPLCQRGRKEMTDFSFLSLRGGLLHDVAVSKIAAHTACARNDSNSGFPITSGMTCGGSK